MAISHAVVAVGTTAVALHTGVETDAQRGHSILIQNESTTNPVYVGSSSVTSTAFGFKLMPSSGTALTALAIDLQYGEQLYAICAAGQSANVYVLRQGI